MVGGHRFGLTWRALAFAGALTVSTAACSIEVAGRPSASTPLSVGGAAASTTATAATARPIPSRQTSSSAADEPRAQNTRSVDSSLPLPFDTGTATQVLTVTAGSTTDTSGVLQAWHWTGSGWQRYGSPMTAWLGSDGLTTQPSEETTATPIGSFTMTQAFGREPNPGTDLPYRQTTPADWWISEPGPLYNTVQHCSASCPFDTRASGSNPNEHLYYELPYYDYAVVVDANTANSPTGVRPDGGSAYFLHVTVGAPTQGCVSVAEPALVSLMRWLVPSAHPRILIGVG